MSRYPQARSPLPFRTRADLYAQLAQMEISGLPFDRAMALLGVPAAAQARLAAMRVLLAKGVEFALAGEKSGLFTKLDARLIQAALQAGSPANMYRRLADYYAARAMQLATMKSRLMLPAFMFIAVLCIQPLPALAGGSLSVVGYFWHIVKPILLVAVAIAGFRFWLGGDKKAPGKSPYQSMPLYGPIFVRRNLRDFFESLALMLEAGVSMLDALPAALDTVEDSDMRRQLAKIRERIAQGAPLSDALRGIGYIRDERVIEFARTGENSGTLPAMLMRHTQMETDAINSFLEQLALWVPRVVYGVVVVWIAYGLLTGGGLLPNVPKDI